MKINSVIRTSDIFINANAYRTAAKEYYVCYVIDMNGSEIPCLLTSDDITKGIDRADKNPEDVKPLSRFQAIYHRLLNLFQ